MMPNRVQPKSALRERSVLIFPQLTQIKIKGNISSAYQLPWITFRQSVSEILLLLNKPSRRTEYQTVGSIKTYVCAIYPPLQSLSRLSVSVIYPTGMLVLSRFVFAMQFQLFSD